MFTFSFDDKPPPLWWEGLRLFHKGWPFFSTGCCRLPSHGHDKGLRLQPVFMWTHISLTDQPSWQCKLQLVVPVHFARFSNQVTGLHDSMFQTSKLQSLHHYFDRVNTFACQCNVHNFPWWSMSHDMFMAGMLRTWPTLRTRWQTCYFIYGQRGDKM